MNKIHNSDNAETPVFVLDSDLDEPINKIKKENAALERFFKFFLGKKGHFLFETYKNAGFPHGADGEGFWFWIQEQAKN